MNKFIRLLIPSIMAVLIAAAWMVKPQVDSAEFIAGDLLPDAPELAQRGDFRVGVRTLDLLDRDRLDVLNMTGDALPKYDRPLTVEIWYPAHIPTGEDEVEIYAQVMGTNGNPNRPIIPFTFKGRSLREARADLSDGPYPLLILSHGYTGSRLGYTYLTEHLASKGYVIVSIDHTESTYKDAGAFASTLLNRSLDDLFVLNEMDRLSKAGSDSFLAGLLDADNTGLLGYSMGGYGAVNVIGGGYSSSALGFFAQVTQGSKALEMRAAGNAEFEASIDKRIKAAVTFAPWGMNHNAWDSTGLHKIKTPILLISGSEDDISGYENGVKKIFDNCKNTDRYLLTFLNARHNVAQNPPPPETTKPGLHIDEYLRYADSAWDIRRVNNVNQHFVSAFLGMHLKGKEYGKYFDVPVASGDSTWNGFKPRTAVGLELRHSSAN